MTRLQASYTSYSISLGNNYILAVEDSLVQAKKLQYFFNENHITTKFFNNAVEAFEVAKKDPPILVISDIVMPGMDGYEFCSQLKNHPDLCEIPVILLTSLRDPLDIIKGLQAGADNFITKPYEDQYLLSRIHYLLANRDMRMSGVGDMAIEIAFQGHKYQINSDKKQILNLLLSVYEDAVLRNNELIDAKKQLELLNLNLQLANEELDAFAHTVSHDLQSPLTGIIGFAQICIDDLPDLADKTIENNLHWVLKSAGKMSRLITALLNYSSSARAEIKIEPLDLIKVAQEIIDDLQAREPDRKVHFQLDESMEVQGDHTLIKSALTNLLENAWKYTSNTDKPVITFRTTLLYGRLVYYIEDNGVGFDMDRADKLFMPFVRLHSNQEFQGSGVGLSTVKRIIERHNGAIWVESEPGKGAKFYFTLNEK